MLICKNFVSVRPNPPEKLSGIGKSPHSIKLEWTFPLFMEKYPGGIRHRVCWCNEESKEWNTIHLTNKNISERFRVKGRNVSFLLENLPYAHCIYDIRVSIEPKVAVDDRMWSQNTSGTFRTLSKIPDCPPNTTFGGFEILDGRGKRLIYWQNVHGYQENGDNFTYSIQAVEDPSIKPVQLFKTYAVFDRLPNINITFKIWSVNSEGKSLDHSIVFVPAQRFGK